MSLLDAYRQSLKMAEVEELLDLAVYRPLAFLLVKPISRTRLTPNHLTGIAMLFGITAGVLLAAVDPTAHIFPAVFLVLYIVLDCADGQLARLKRSGTRVGRILDGISDYIVETTLYVGLMIGLTRSGQVPASTWALAAAAAASNIVHAVLLDYYRNLFLDTVLRRVSLFEEDLRAIRAEYRQLKTGKGHLFEKFVLWIYLRYSGFQLRLASGRKECRAPRCGAEEYYRRNRLAIRLWTFLGTTTQMSFFIVCLLLGRIDVYFWGLIIAGNLFAVVMLVFQGWINRAVRPAPAV